MSEDLSPATLIVCLLLALSDGPWQLSLLPAMSLLTY